MWYCWGKREVNYNTMASFKNITSAATTVVKASPGLLKLISINTDGAGAITMYDHASAASGRVIGVIESAAPHGSYFYEVDCSLGIVVVTAATIDITVVYE